MQGTLNSSTARLHGLDTLRAFAIIIVLLFHYMVVVTNENTFGYITQIGWMGVDLFFVLSGYLIGNQVLSAAAKKQSFSLRLFYIRRLLRTLPNYYAVFALYFIFSSTLTGSSTEPVWKFLTFTQNFHFLPGTTFSHSWSLCIEEQFYLIFPVLFLILAKARQSIALAWLAVAVGIVLGLATRIYIWNNFGQAGMNFRDYFQHIYYSSFTRFDELLPGIAIALLKNYHTKAFTRLMSKANWLLAGGLICTGILFYVFPHYHVTEEFGYNFFLSTFGYSLVAMSFALLTLAALSPNSVLGQTKLPGATQIALWSYAIYLIHKPIFKLMIEPLTQWKIDVKSVLGICIIMGMSLTCGWLLFLFVETPFMKLRTRFFPSNIALQHHAKPIDDAIPL
jgi:peptidoglycan/LPS O-acetylase OafA/YrhL